MIMPSSTLFSITLINYAYFCLLLLTFSYFEYNSNCWITLHTLCIIFPTFSSSSYFYINLYTFVYCNILLNTVAYLLHPFHNIFIYSWLTIYYKSLLRRKYAYNTNGHKINYKFSQAILICQSTFSLLSFVLIFHTINMILQE